MPGPAPAPPTELVAVLRRQGLIGDDVPPMTPLAGGVSSDIWRVDLPSGPVCVKRALGTLKVAATWHAPVERTGYEAAWMEVAVVRVARPVPRAARLRRRRRLAGDDLPRCPGAPSLEDRAARRPDRWRRGGRARPKDRRDARRHRRPDRRGGPVRQPGAVRGPAAGALPGHDGACPRRPRDGARGGAGRLPGQPAGAPPRRRQPEERARWARRAGAARRGVRHLGRSRVRPRLLPRRTCC